MSRLLLAVRVAVVAVVSAIAAAVVAAAPAPAASPTGLLDPATVAARLGFSAGERPLALRAPDGGSLSARSCGSCHTEVYADWQTTRHRAAWDNAVFLDGLAREPLARCVHCHAPLVEQKREAGPLRGRTFPPSSSSSLLHEGVTCAVCHVRGGRVLTTRPVQPDAATPMHDIVVEPALKDPAFCASCHQFGFTGSDALMQGTWSEWRAFADAGGQGTCQSCHMPGGRHLFRGAWDHELLRQSLVVDVDRGPDGVALVLHSRGVGHHFPTGDLFRHLTVEVSDVVRAGVDDDGAFVDVFRIGRTFGGAGLDKRVVEDTSLEPGVPRRVPLPSWTRRWRVRYHYAEARHERAGVVVPVVIAAGSR